MRLTSLIVPILYCSLLPLAVSAQQSTPLPTDTTNALPLEPERTLRFTTDEGTWISLDVSPDGNSIVFDLLGDLYTLPITGGNATRITEGMPWDGMPRWSPDGETIAFISDRDGGDNLWLVAPDGSNLRRLTAEQTHTLSSPAWTPDGDYLVVRRFGQYPSAENYLTNVPLWMIHVNGASGTQVYPASATTKTTNTGAAFSPDGKTMYFSSHAGGYTGENIGAYQVIAFDLERGEERTLTAGWGGGLRPIASADGRWLVYATRADTRTALRIRNLETHDDRWLVDEIQRDDQEGYAPNDILPGYAFTPDSRAVVYYGGGKIHRVEVDTREITNIPFSVDVELGMAERLQLPLTVSDDSLQVTQLLWVSESPDGQQIAFSALGRLWTAPMENGRSGAPTRITDGEWKEYYPSFSPDGAWIAYVTWTDSLGGFLWKTRADGSGSPQRLTGVPATIKSPRWHPNGDRIVFSWSPRRAGLGAGPVASLVELRSVGASGGDVTTIAHATSAPSLVTAGNPLGRVYFTEPVPNSQPGFNATRTTALVSVRLDGAEKRTHAKITSPNSGPVTVEVSPDGRAIAVLERDDLYVLPLAPAGEEGLAINLQSPAVPLRRLTNEGANYAQWTDEGRTLVWSFANRVHRAPLDSIMASVEPDDWGMSQTEIMLRVPRAIPRGELLLRGARIVTMNGDEIVESGDILIRDNRIAAVGATVTAPMGATVIDVTGTTIIPGLVDTHAHPNGSGREFAPDQDWSVSSNLAYGVTTTRNPSGSRWNMAWGELIEAGEMVGSRIWATGFPLTSNNVQVNSYEDALHVVRRYKRQGVHSIKQYLQPRRIQRQWILQAGRAEGINVTNEGAADLRMDISMAVDGFSGLEHSIGQVPLYKDVVTVLADARIAYTATLVVAYGAPSGDGYFRARTDLDKDPKTSYFTPTETLFRRVRRRPMIVEEDYNFPEIARGVRDVVRAGGLAGLGSHGQQDGIAAHWELWMLQSGDMTNHEALKIATILGAESIGYGRDLGSIEVGKLADLVVLNDNPLDDIRNTTSIRYVIKNGELYDADTLDRIWPTARAFPKPYWVEEQEDLELLRRR